MLEKKVLLQIDHTSMGNAFKILDGSVPKTGGVTVTRGDKFLAPISIVMSVDTGTVRRLENDAINDDGVGLSQGRAADQLEILYTQGINLLSTKPKDFSLPEKVVGTLIGLVISRP